MKITDDRLAALAINARIAADPAFHTTLTEDPKQALLDLVATLPAEDITGYVLVIDTPDRIRTHTCTNRSNRRWFVEELADIAIRLIEREEQEDTNHGK